MGENESREVGQNSSLLSTKNIDPILVQVNEAGGAKGCSAESLSDEPGLGL